MAIRLPRETNGGPTLRYHGAMRLRKLLVGVICLPLLTPGWAALTSAGIDAVDRDSAKLRATLEAAPKLPLEQTELPVNYQQAKNWAWFPGWPAIRRSV
jgi:hypothetical protein